MAKTLRNFTRLQRDKRLKVAGRVTSGTGDFGQWIGKLQDHYERLTGMRFFPGTLNVTLDQPYELPKRRLRLEKEAYGGTVSVNLVPCRIGGRDAFVLRTDANDQGVGDHPKKLVEIACDVRLRDIFALTDGDDVELELPMD